MKKLLLAGILLAGTSAAFMQPAQASALDVSWSTKCSSFGALTTGVNPSLQHVNCLLTQAALANGIPPEVLKSVATQEKGDWKHFESDGSPYVSLDNGIGLMQITNHPEYETDKLKNDVAYNIQAGAEILNSMYLNRPDLPKTTISAQKNVIENWYFPVMAYNGIKPINSPIVKTVGSPDYGKINSSAYQEEVFQKIEDNLYFNAISLGNYPFAMSDFEYDSTKNDNIVFKKLLYTLTDEMHETNYKYSSGNRVLLTKLTKMRSKPDTSGTFIDLPAGTELTVTGPFVFTETKDSLNQIVWYPVKTLDGKSGFVTSAYIKKKLTAPLINIVDDNDTSISGKTLPNVKVTIIYGTTKKMVVSDAYGNFKYTVPVQKAGTKITAAYKDSLNRVSLTATSYVIDKTPPALSAVNTVTSISTTVTGKAEPNSSIIVMRGTSTIGKGKTDAYGKFSATISKQVPGTKLTVYAVDSANNKSAKTLRVADKTPPAPPVINSVNAKTTLVTGSAEKFSTVTLKVGTRVIGSKAADAYGKFKITITVQKRGTVITGTAKDAAGNISSMRKVTVQ